MIKKINLTIIFLLPSLWVLNNCGESKKVFDDLTINSKKIIGQIEVGGPFAGIEIHNSFPMLNRISFYYPVANSIDISQDYWNRQNYRIMTSGLKIDDTIKTILPNENYEVTQTPYSVLFEKIKYESIISIGYEFCKSKPAFVITYTIKNISKSKKKYEFYTRMEATLRTSHSYKKIDKAFSYYDKSNNSLVFDYKSNETGNAVLFISNAGLESTGFTSKFINGENPDSLWLNTDLNLTNEIISEAKLEKPTAAFSYKKNLLPNEEIKVIQIVGMVDDQRVSETIKDIVGNYKNEILDYKNYVEANSQLNNLIHTGDNSIDFTSRWSKAILSTNAHYIDGDVVPMPAQAEYNFYFTHDALLTDLAAVNFDIERVKTDLEFITKHADKDNIIPHAYYWKDNSYKTEYCGTENWNHFWFTIVASRYFKHSKDYDFAEKLYPFVKKSVDTALKNRGDDNLMWSFRPDWWDIGNNYGPRAYMTILAIRALQEFCYLSSSLDIDEEKVIYYHSISDSLNANLNKRLWNADLNYLTSFFEDGSEDKHIYMGSMLAAHFDLLGHKRNKELMATAGKKLLDKNIGIYTLYPMDLHKLGDYLGFSGNEAGAPYYYANGGIWPHGNAWYALGLIKIGENEEAFNFLKKIMTIDGITNSPNGQPALYEYRISDKYNPEVYGKIDKPQFLWAGGWYIYTLYNLLGLNENEWNISIKPYIPENINEIKFFVVLNGMNVPITIKGEGKYIESMVINDMEIPSAIIPEDISMVNNIDVILGKITKPYLTKANGIVEKINYDHKTSVLNFKLSALENINIDFEILSPFNCNKIICDGKIVEFSAHQITTHGSYKITCKKRSINKSENYKIYLNGNNG